MSTKPSYLGLLNAIALGESRAHTYLTAWAGVTPSDEVRQVLLTVAAREGEHGMAFAKRINELGYEVKPKDDPNFERVCAIASSDRTDLDKMEKLGLGKLDTGDKPDFFDGFFTDHSIDIQTGGLLGRYIAEERDSARLLRSCYDQLRTAGSGSSDQPRMAALEDKVDELCRTVEALCEQLGSASAGNGRKKKSASSARADAG